MRKPACRRRRGSRAAARSATQSRRTHVRVRLPTQRHACGSTFAYRALRASIVDPQRRLGSRLSRLGRRRRASQRRAGRGAKPAGGAGRPLGSSLFRRAIHRRAGVQPGAAGRPGRSRSRFRRRRSTFRRFRPRSRGSSATAPSGRTIRSSRGTRRGISISPRPTPRCCSGSASWRGNAGRYSGFAAGHGSISASMRRASRGFWRSTATPASRPTPVSPPRCSRRRFRMTRAFSVFWRTH